MYAFKALQGYDKDFREYCYCPVPAKSDSDVLFKKTYFFVKCIWQDSNLRIGLIHKWSMDLH